MAKAIVRGDKEIIANMRRAYNSVGGRQMDKTLAVALTPMKEQVEANALRHRQPGNPRGGHLDQGVVIHKNKAVGIFYREFWITFRKRARKIAHLVEFGTAPHWQPNRGIMHPGARPFPFVRPAFEQEKEETADMIGAMVWSQISRAIRSAAIVNRTGRR